MKRPTDPDEIVKCADDPLYYYNNYLKHPKAPEMTREEFDKNVKEFAEQRDKVVPPEVLEEYRNKVYRSNPFEGKPDPIEHIADKLANEVEPFKNKAENKNSHKEKKKLTTRIKNKLAKKSRKKNR